MSGLGFYVIILSAFCAPVAALSLHEIETRWRQEVGVRLNTAVFEFIDGGDGAPELRRQQLSREFGDSLSSISRIVSGERALEFERGTQIARFLAVPPSELLAFDFILAKINAGHLDRLQRVPKGSRIGIFKGVVTAAFDHGPTAPDCDVLLKNATLEQIAVRLRELGRGGK